MTASSARRQPRDVWFLRREGLWLQTSTKSLEQHRLQQPHQCDISAGAIKLASCQRQLSGSSPHTKVIATHSKKQERGPAEEQKEAKGGGAAIAHPRHPKRPAQAVLEHIHTAAKPNSATTEPGHPLQHP